MAATSRDLDKQRGLCGARFVRCDVFAVNRHNHHRFINISQNYQSNGRAAYIRLVGHMS